MGITANKLSFSLRISKRFYKEDIGNKLEDFEILQKIGKGGNGYAIKVRSKKNLKTYVIKRNPIEQKKEIILLTKLSHDNVCKCLSDFKEGDYFYIVMDLYNNKDLFHFLSAYMETNTKINEAIIWDILNQCLDALVYIHNKGLIHRDIKLANIFMNDTGKVVIGDFGHCAVVKNEYLKNYTSNPQEQEMLKFEYTDCGTINFKAPEMIEGYPYDQKVDVYSLGVCLYCLCCQIVPNPDNYQIALQQNNYYSFDLRNIIYNMLIKDPNQRPNSSDLYQIYKQNYINKFVANTSLYSVIQCFFNYQNCIEYFSSPFKIDYILDTEYKKEVALALLGTKNNFDNKTRVDESTYVLRNIICRENKIKDNIELSPSHVINFMLIALGYELNEISRELINSGITNSQKYCNFHNFNEFVNFYNSKFRSLISENFCGVLKKTFKCTTCRYESTEFQKYNFISFNLNNYNQIYKQNSINIIDIFNYYNSNSILLGFNKHINCKNCNDKREHYLIRQFYCFPKNLIIMFEQNNNNINVEYFDEIYLNEQKDPETSYKYNLTGIICDIKNRNNGITKYVCFIKKYNNMNNYNWVYCDNKSDESGKTATLSFIQTYGIVVSLFYYCEVKNTFNINEDYMNDMNYNSLRFYKNMNNQVNEFIFNNMFMNINYDNRNINNTLQTMVQNPMENNNFNNNINLNNNNNFGINNNMNDYAMNMNNMNNYNNNNNMGNNMNYMNNQNIQL